jgi:TRAP-type C4-dicarboxylate transport system substrate-binding protein
MVKKLSVLLSVLVITLLVISLVISCASKPKEVVILRLAVPQAAGDPITVNLEEMAKRFNERTDEYQINVFPGETLVKMTEALDSVRTGAVEVSAGVPWPMFAGSDMRFGEVIHVFNNFHACATAAQDPELFKLYDDIFLAKFNQHALAVFPFETPQLISKKPVKTLEDWKGLLVAVPAPVAADYVTLLGGASVSMPWTDYYSALEKGVVDAALAGTNHMQTAKLTDVASYVTICTPYGVFAGHTINLDVWNAMPKNIQDILLEEAAWSAQGIAEYLGVIVDNEVGDLTALGMDVYTVPTAERDKWKAATQSYVDQHLAEMGEFGQKIRQIADKANALNP